MSVEESGVQLVMVLSSRGFVGSTLLEDPCVSVEDRFSKALK